MKMQELEVRCQQDANIVWTDKYEGWNSYVDTYNKPTKIATLISMNLDIVWKLF